MCVLDDAVKTLITSTFMSFGFLDTNDDRISVTGRNVSLTTSNLNIPMLGTESSEGRYSDPNSNPLGTLSGITVYLQSNLASGSGNLQFSYINLTTSTSNGFTGTISPGNASGYIGSNGVSVSSGDQVAIIFSMASGSLVIPSFQVVIDY